jgi:hypothetical protein
MKEYHYCRPKSYYKGSIYFIREVDQNGQISYKPVKFIGYRPHPGELIIRNNSKTIVIHRRWLFTKIETGFRARF